MPKISRDESNIVTIPMSVSVHKNGYVYANITTTWVAKKNGTGKMADHEKICIGIALHPGKDWAEDRRMYANQAYYTLYGDANKKENPDNSKVETEETVNSTKDTSIVDAKAIYEEYPERSDNISVGLFAAVKKKAESSGLRAVMDEVFEEEIADILLDLATYMLSDNSAVFQHFPHWARSHALFSSTIRSDSYISNLMKEGVSLSKINLFKTKWARIAIGDGRVFVCYDSTNVNSQAEGVFIVQKGYAKDDPDKDQVNTEYTIRQEDGLPITFKNFPGSINDMSEASEMIQYYKELLEDWEAAHADDETAVGIARAVLSIIMIADRGYTSEENIRSMRDAGIGFILMLKKNMKIVDTLLNDNMKDVKKAENYLDDGTGRFAKTVKAKLFEDDTKDSWFHIIWDPELEVSHRTAFMNELKNKEKALQKAKDRKTLMTDEDFNKYRDIFKIKYHEGGQLKQNKRGRGAGKTKTVPAYVIDSFERDEAAVERGNEKCGYFITVSSDEMTATEAIGATSKRDCVEKVFRALKSSLGMDKIGVHFESSMHTKSLVWFIASILHALIFTSTQSLRKRDKKRGTVPAVINDLEEVTADKDLETGQYRRRYKPGKQQRKALNALGITVNDIDDVIAGLA